MAVTSWSPHLSTDSEMDHNLTRGRDFAMHAAIFLIAFLLLFARRPDAILHAQFYAEDGAYFYSDAYQFGWRCLLMPYGGYLSTLLRLIGLLAQLVPFGLAPLVMNLCAIAIQILPVNLFLSARFKAISYNVRVFASLLYLAIPNAFEIHANTTNIQWHLALLALLVLLSQAEAAKAWLYFDYAVLFFALLDGPLGILLVPIAAFLLWVRRDRRTALALGVMIPFAVVQSLFILFSNSRRPAPNGASFERLTGILGGQIFFSAIFGLRSFIRLFVSHVHWLPLIETVALVIGLAIMLYAFRFGPMELKVLVFYAAIGLTFALIHPIASFAGEQEQWALLQVPGCGNRYYFFPMLAFFASLIWMLMDSAKSKVPRYAALAVLLFLPVGICRDWQYKPFIDMNFQDAATAFEGAPPGTTISIPINPNWHMRLTKH